MTFALGDTVMFVPGHGTHHRAQGVNMLRQLGARTPKLDYVQWLRESQA
ncbi:MAG: DinB family protein [Phycisphaerae bacterium]